MQPQTVWYVEIKFLHCNLMHPSPSLTSGQESGPGKAGCAKAGWAKAGGGPGPGRHHERPLLQTVQCHLQQPPDGPAALCGQETPEADGQAQTQPGPRHRWAAAATATAADVICRPFLSFSPSPLGRVRLIKFVFTKFWDRYYRTLCLSDKRANVVVVLSLDSRRVRFWEACLS